MTGLLRLQRWSMLLLASCASVGAQAASHVFLVQNSGWMEPFYADPTSPYKALVTEVVQAAMAPGDALVLAAFNQSLPGAPSPRALLAQQGKPDRAKLRGVLDPLEVGRKPGGKAMADTDLGEAVGSAIDGALGGKPGLVWLFTNNRNSPNNDQATARRNREFYQLIHEGAAIRKALAFPLKMPVQGAQYSAGGLMVYVFAVQEQGARELDALLASGRLKQVITEMPARLKPLDQDTVRLVPARVENTPGVRYAVLPDGRLRAELDAGKSASATPDARITWRLENTMYPYTITAADISAQAALAGEVKPVALQTDSVRNLAPGRPQPLASSLSLPVANLPGKWSMAALSTAGSAQVIPGRIEVRLANQRLELSQAFRQRMAELFPGDPLPDIFTPPARIQHSRAVLPVEVRLQYGAGPLLAAIGGLFAVLAAAGALAVAATRGRKVLVTVDGEPRTIRTKAGARTPLYNTAGEQVAELHASLFGQRLANVREGASVRLGK
ncbi:hypothetical protein [Pseudoduganella umbonata]|uniref:Uncharacterized protein n=1 Tax=Pseudoduganella umbonata TaxID=864828 RepID=A0A4P8HSU0_9BURK|nr:hypothetical protein [Pseudoduganella umbonata]MBB3220961.1 hypothetical protein [Pseudoduganella umbonata]QCP11590.1 hypothetical protein FCL38_15060 [Pseudoduganella umbonata]